MAEETKKLSYEKDMPDGGRLIVADAGKALQDLPDETVDLCYIDPPFFTSRQYEVIWKDGAEIRAFEDRWVKMGEGGRMTKDINVYLGVMSPILKEIHRVLKKTGSFYLHCDWHADAYLRVECDRIFQRDPTSVIVWQRAAAKNAAIHKWDVLTDTILFYSKSDNYHFVPQYGGVIEKSAKGWKWDASRKKYYCLVDLTAPGTNRQFEWRGLRPSPKRSWAYSRETLEAMFEAGEIKCDETGKPMIHGRIQWLETLPKVKIGNLWTDIPMCSRKESLGYPTQKPEALLERIIRASSKEGDLVLDCFCGCGTSIAVAKRLNRRFLGIDISPTAIRLVARRIGYRLSEIIGLPMTEEEVAGLTGFEFQNAVIRLFAKDNLTAISLGKRGADGGVDGYYYDIPIQVKKTQIGADALKNLIATLIEKGKKEGILIGLSISSGVTKEISKWAAHETTPLVIHAFSLEDLVKEKHIPFLQSVNRAHGRLM